jgi:hypothetical protein
MLDSAIAVALQVELWSVLGTREACEHLSKRAVSMQIIVLGAPRSGSSLITRLINMMGAFFDTGHASIGFSDENPRGFWERSDVIACNDRLLSLQQCRWDRLARWKPLSHATSRKATKSSDTAAHDIEEVLRILNANRPWVIKDPRLCMTLPHWRPKLEKPVMVCVHRDPLEVALSLQARHRFSIAHGLAMWEYYTIHMLNGLADLPVIHVSHHDLIREPIATTKRLHAALEKAGVEGLRIPSEQEITTFIDPTLHRSIVTPETSRAQLSDDYQQLCAMSMGHQPLPSKLLEPSLAARDAMDVYESTMQMQEQLRTLHERCSQAEQEAHTLRDIRQKILTDVQGEILRMRREIEQKNTQLQRVRASASWRVGHLLVRLVTLRWLSRDTPAETA